MELLRQLEIFDPDKNDNKSKRIDLIGVGATGSYIAFLLAKIGMMNIHVWDADIIKDHNIPNQIYFEKKHIGLNKVDALKDIIFDATGTIISCHNEMVGVDKIEIGNVVYLLTDKMSSRKEIFNNNLKLRPNISCVIETRMGSNSGRIYTFNPNVSKEYKAWEETLYNDDEAETSACGASISIAPTACLIASMAVWKLIKFFEGITYSNEIIICTNPWFIMSRKF